MGDQTILFESYIDGFIMGRLDLDTLLVTFRQSIRQDPLNAGRLVLLLEKRLYEGDLPTAAYSALKRELKLPNATEAGALTQTIAAPDADTGEEEDDFFLDEEEEAPPAARNKGKAETVVRQAEQENEKTQLYSEPEPTGDRSDLPGKKTTASDWPIEQMASGGDEVLQVGSIIKERFQLLQTLGKGGMGVVYKAIDQRKVEAEDRDPYLAVKVLNEAFKQHPQALRALQREARKTQELAHPNIMTVYDFDRQGSNVYMTMEFMDGEELADLIKQRKKENRPFTLAEAFNIIEQMCNGLGYAHRKGLVHSDFKPGNVFVTKNGTVKLLDFGIASRVKPSDAVGVDDGGDKTAFDPKELGAFTPAYASCEILEGEVSHQTDDIYALACVAYQLLGGKHPFNRLKATDARDANLKPAPIPGLTKRQNRALAKGLAFTKQERSQSVEEFLESIRPRKSRVLPIAAGVVGAIIVLGLAARGPIITYLDEQREAELVSKLTNPAAMPSALEELKTLDDNNIRRNILEKGREGILGYYTDLIDAAIDDTKGNYGYPEAEKQLGEARQLYPDSAQIERIRDNISARKSKLINELTTAFNELIDQGKLLPQKEPKEGELDIPTILTIVSKVDPEQALLTNPRLEPAYSRAANTALKENDLERAEALVLAGLERFSNSSTLLDLRDGIGMRKQEAGDALMVARIESKLKAMQLPNDMGAFSGIREDLLALKKTNPSHPLLATYTEQLDQVMKKTLAGMAAVRGWENGQSLLSDYGALLDARFVRASSAQLALAQARFDQEINGLFNQFQSAVAANRLTEPAEPNAKGLLAALTTKAPENIRVDMARAQLAVTYQTLARRARDSKNWRQADQYLDLALAQTPVADWKEALQFEKARLADAESLASGKLPTEKQQAMLAAQEQQVSALYNEFNAVLPKLLDDQEITPTHLMTLLHKAAAIKPGDPQVEENSKKLADAITARATGLAEREEWKSSAQVLQQGLVAMPDSKQLSLALAKVFADSKSELAKAEEKQAKKLQVSLEGLLANPEFSKAWQAELGAQLTAFSQLALADPQWSAEIRNRIAELYITQAASTRDNQRYAEARSLLIAGQKLLPEEPRFAQELTTLQTAQAEFTKKAEQEALVAEIEGRKQTLLTQAKANDVQNALLTFNQLKASLPENDPFITETAPDLIGTAYFNVAKRLADSGKYQDASGLVEKGLKIASQHKDLGSVRNTYQQEAYAAELLAAAPKATNIDASRYQDMLEELRKNSPSRYQQISEQVGNALLTRIQSLQATDTKTAASLLQSAKQLFPAHGGLGQLVISSTEPTKEAQPPASKPEKPAAVASARPASPSSCTKGLAGYGTKARGTCFDMVTQKARGPTMVVVPGEQTFAISKFEISVRDYNSYCAVSGSCKPIQGDFKLPVTGIPVDAMEKYANWLSEKTGFAYRLPTDSEWVYAATANGGTEGKDFNCLLRMGGNTLKGSAMLPVNSGKPNNWGLVNHIGNAQEVVTDGASVALRGGAYVDPMAQCGVSLKRDLSGAIDENTGFRLVREIKG